MLQSPSTSTHTKRTNEKHSAEFVCQGVWGRGIYEWYLAAAIDFHRVGPLLAVENGASLL